MMPTMDVFDELAALFLTEPGAGVEHQVTATATESAAMKSRPTIELLLPGHLPVRGSLWLGAYADAVARREGPTALLRLDHAEPSVELFRAQMHQAENAAPLRIDQVMQQFGPAATTWIIRPVPGTPLGEVLTAMCCDATHHGPDAPDRLTLLTGADEAATVALYQTIKQLYEASLAAGRALPTMAVAVVGTDELKARTLMARLNRTTAAFLGVPIELALTLPRFDAAIRSTHRQRIVGGPGLTLGAAVAEITRAAAIGATASAPARNGASQTRSLAHQHHRATAGTSAPPPPQQLSIKHLPEQPASTAAANKQTMDASPLNGLGFDPERVVVASRTAKLAPKPVRTIMDAAADPLSSTVRATPRLPASLAEHLEGLTALPARCPDHDTIELAVDAHGRLHVLGRVDDLRVMLIVQRWAAAHAKLLSLACPDRKIDAAGAVALDVVTDRPVAVADLHGTDLRLHVLALVQVAGQTAWYAAPLNQSRERSPAAALAQKRRCPGPEYTLWL